MKRRTTSKSTDLNALADGLLRLDEKKAAFDKSADEEVDKLEKQLLRMKSSTKYDWKKYVDWESLESSSERFGDMFNFQKLYQSIPSDFDIDEVQSLTASDLKLNKSLHEFICLSVSAPKNLYHSIEKVIVDYKRVILKEEKNRALEEVEIKRAIVKEEKKRALPEVEIKRALIVKQKISQEKEVREKNEQLITKRRSDIVLRVVGVVLGLLGFYLWRY